MEIIPQLDKTFDLVFIDADKNNYPNYLEIILPKLKKGSVILSDNVLWSGKVVEKVKEDDEDTKALIHYNKLLNEHAETGNSDTANTRWTYNFKSNISEFQ